VTDTGSNPVWISRCPHTHCSSCWPAGTASALPERGPSTPLSTSILLIHSPEHLHPSHPQPPVSSDSWLPLLSFRCIAGASLIRNTTSMSFNECVPRCSQTPEIPSSSLPEHRIWSLYCVHAHTCCAQLLEKSGSPSPQRALPTTSV